MSIKKNPSPGYQVDGRVSIALDALDEKQKRVVGKAIADRDHFMAIAADPRKVARISTRMPLFSLRLPSDLRIIYSQSEDGIIVMDLMKKSTLDRYGSKAKSPNGKKNRRSPRLKKGL